MCASGFSVRGFSSHAVPWLWSMRSRVGTCPGTCRVEMWGRGFGWAYRYLRLFGSRCPCLAACLGDMDRVVKARRDSVGGREKVFYRQLGWDSSRWAWRVVDGLALVLSVQRGKRLLENGMLAVNRVWCCFSRELTKKGRQMFRRGMFSAKQKVLGRQSKKPQRVGMGGWIRASGPRTSPLMMESLSGGGTWTRSKLVVLPWKCWRLT